MSVVETVAAVEEAVDWADNPSRILHALCPYCYPMTPPIGTPTTRWCGQVHTIKDGTEIRDDGTPPPDACIVCAELDTCATCGARRTFLGILPPSRGGL